MMSSTIGVFIVIPSHVLHIDFDILLVACYIPPEGSTFYTDESNSITLLENDLIQAIEQAGTQYILILGDFNSRTGTQLDFIYDDSSENLPMDEGYISDNFNIPRISCNVDERINSFGKSLLYMCKMLDIHIVNGRFQGDSEGQFTCITSRGASVVDYCIASSNLFKHIDNFGVLNENYVTSVHFPICCSFVHKSVQTHTKSDMPAEQRRRYVWNYVNGQVFIDNLMSVLILFSQQQSI